MKQLYANIIKRRLVKMSLLWMEYEKEFQDLTESSFLHEQKNNAEYFASLNKRVHKIIYRDTRYNVDFLYTS